MQGGVVWAFRSSVVQVSGARSKRLEAWGKVGFPRRFRLGNWRVQFQASGFQGSGLALQETNLESETGP